MTNEQANKIISLLEGIDEKLNLALGIEPIKEDSIIEMMNNEKLCSCEKCKQERSNDE